MIVKVYGATDIGKRRALNEDTFGIRGFENGVPDGVCVLADGMGGHNAGEVASSIAVNSVVEKLSCVLGEKNSDKIEENIADAINYANTSVYEMSLKNREQAGMGTTLVVTYVSEQGIKIANIGDSRAYGVTENEIVRLTVDHSVVEELVQRGTITREEARIHPDKNIITRALGTDSYVVADYFEYEFSPGQAIVMCSDGLSEMLEEDRIKEIITKTEDIQEAVKCLIDEANQNGGVDNVTVVALRFEEEVETDDVDR